MPQRVITLSFNLGNKEPTDHYLDWLAGQINDHLGQGQGQGQDQQNSTKIVISAQEQPRRFGFSLAHEIKQRLTASEGNNLTARRIGRASFTTQTKAACWGRVTTSILSLRPTDEEKQTEEKQTEARIWQDEQCNTNKGTATVTVGQLQASGLHLSSDNDEQRAREFYESMRIPCDGTTTHKQMQALSETYFQRIVLGDFNYRNTTGGQQPLFDNLPQTRMLRMMSFTPATRPNGTPSTSNSPNEWQNQPRGNGQELRGGLLDAMGGFDCGNPKSKVTFGQMQILNQNDQNNQNLSDHFPVLSVATIDDDNRTPFQKVRDMVWLELQHFADNRLLETIALMENDTPDNRDKLVIYFNYFMVIKHTWAQAELLRLSSDNTHKAIHEAIIGAPQQGREDSPFFTTATQTDEGQPDGCMVAKLVTMGNDTFNSTEFIQPANRKDTVQTLKARAGRTIQATQLTIPATHSDFFQSCAEVFSRMFRFFQRLVYKADTTAQQKREKHDEHLGGLLSRGFCTFGAHDTHSNDDRLSNASSVASYTR